MIKDKIDFIFSRFLITAVISFIVLIQPAANSQPKTEMVGLVKGDSVIIIPAVPPARGGGLNFYKKSAGGQFVLLNTAGPVLPITDDALILEAFGNRWETFSSELSLREPADLVFLLSEDPQAFFMIAFRYPEVIKIAGCWYADKITDKKGESEYRIDYLDETRNTVRSVTRKLKLKETSLPVPTDVTAKPEGNKILIEWNYPEMSKDLSDLTTQFLIYRKQANGSAERLYNGVIPRDNNTSFSYYDESVENGVEYSYYVTAVDLVGNESGQSSPVMTVVYDKTPPAVPDEVKADSVEGSIGVSWKMNLELDARGYNVYRSLKVDRDFVKINTGLLPVDKTFFYDNNFTFGIQYFYCITCIDKNDNESGKSNPLAILYEDMVPPDPPADFNYRFENNLMKFSWTASKSADVEGYHYYRGESAEVLPRITSDALKSVTYTDSGYSGRGFTPGQRYTFALTAIDKGRNESGKIYIKDVLIPDNDAPEPPQGLMTENVNGNYVAISSGGSVSADVVIYKIFRSEIPSAPVELTRYNSVPFQYTDSTVKKGSAYTYYAIAVDSAGNSSKPGRTDTVLVKDDSPPPSPRSVKAVRLQAGIEIRWEVVYDFDLIGYNVYKSQLPNGNYIKVNKEVVKELKYLDAGGKATEFYKVRSVDTSGNESNRGEYASPK